MVFPRSIPAHPQSRGIDRPPGIEIVPHTDMPEAGDDTPRPGSGSAPANGPLVNLVSRGSRSSAGTSSDFAAPRGPDHEAQVAALMSVYRGISSKLESFPALLLQTDRMVEAILDEDGLSDAALCRKLLLFLSGMGASIPPLQPGSPAILPTALTGFRAATPTPVESPDAAKPAERV